MELVSPAGEISSDLYGLSGCDISKGWLAIAKLKPLVERYSCQPMRRLDTSNNLSVRPSCM